MKKKISILFLIFANTIMFAHAVIPHHHHALSEICVEDNACESACESHEEEKHKHHSSDDVQTCSENQILFNQSNSISSLAFRTIILKYFLGNNDLSAYNLTSPLDYIQISNQYSYSYIIKDERNLANVGLRAPPIV